MSKTINNVKLSADFKIASTRQQLWDSTVTDQTANQNVNVSVAFGVIAKWLADFKSGAFEDAYTHPTYTSKSSGLYKITVDGTGHVSAATAATASDLSGTVPVNKGGTGATTLTSNAIIAGNGTSAVKTIATASGALYATAANGAAQFGTLPVAQGGTGATSASGARTNLGLGTAATANTESTLTNGSNLPTGKAITNYVASQIGALGNILTFKGVVATVSALPTTGNKVGDVYFVGTNTTTGKDDFTEYVWAEVSSGTYEWEYLGKVQTDVDLSDYLTNIGFEQDTTTSELKLKATKTADKGSAEPVAEFALAHASTTKYGVTMLSSATNGTSEALAATEKAVADAYSRASVYDSTVNNTGNGNAVTSVTITNGQIVANKGATFLTAHPTIPTDTDKEITPAQLSHGGTFTAITSVEKDSNGHITKLYTATYTLPASGNTDTKVTQNVAATTVTDTYPLLISAYKTGTTTTTASTVSRIQSIYAQPSTGTINATQFVGGGSGLTGLTASQIGGLNDAIDARRGVTSITADSNGLTGGTITSTGTIGLSLKSTTKLNIDSVAAVTTGTTSRVYPVLLDKSGKLSVNVPWTDTNTKVNVVTRGTTKAYLLGTTTSPTSTATGVTAVAETGVYFDTTAGELHATTLTTTTQASGNSTTKVATTAFVHQDAICDGDTDIIINCVPPSST